MNEKRQVLLIALLLVLALCAAGTVMLRQVHAPSAGNDFRGEFSGSAEALDKTGPAQVLYTEAAPFATGFKLPHALAIAADNRVFVAGDNAVRIFDARGTKLDEIALPEAARCLALDSGGTLFAGLTRRVAAISPQKEIALWESLNEKAMITSVAAGTDSLFAADAGNRIVVRYDLQGHELGRIGRKDPERKVRGFIIPSPYFDVAANASGVLFAANTGCHRVESFDFGGAFLGAWGQSGAADERFCGCCNPAHFALLPGGGFITAEKGLCRVKEYDAQGRFMGLVAGDELFSRAGRSYDSAGNEASALVVHDLAIDSGGRVFVLDPGSDRVRIFERKARN